MAGTAASVTFAAACLTSNPTLGCIGNAGSSGAVAAPSAGWTEGVDQGYSSPTTGAESVWRNSGFTGTVLPWNGVSSTAFGCVGIELDTSAGGLTPVTDDLDIRWDTLGAITDDLDIRWDTLFAFLDDLDIRWDVLSSQ